MGLFDSIKKKLLSPAADNTPPSPTSPTKSGSPAASKAIMNSSPEDPSTDLANPADWLMTVLGGGPTLAGPVVDQESAMRSSAVYACVSLIAGTIGSMPLHVYRDTKNGRELAEDHGLSQAFDRSPNDVMSGFVWRELMGVDILLGGNHFSVVEYRGNGSIAGFYPIPRNAVTISKDARGRLRYRIYLSDGLEEIDQDDMIHVPGLSFDGVHGLSVIANLRQSIGLSLAMEENLAWMHSNGARPSGVVTAEEGYGKDPVASLQRIRSQFDQAYAGLSNVGRTLFLDRGMKWTPMQINPVDSETINNRRFQVADICRAFGVPPYMVGEADGAAFAGGGVEQLMLGFRTFTLQKFLPRIESELNRKLFKGSDCYVEFDRDALFVADPTSRSQYYTKLIENAVVTPAYAARALNLPHHAAADRLFMTTACVPLDDVVARSSRRAVNNAAPASGRVLPRRSSVIGRPIFHRAADDFERLPTGPNGWTWWSASREWAEKYGSRIIEHDFGELNLLHLPRDPDEARKALEAAGIDCSDLNLDFQESFQALGDPETGPALAARADAAGIDGFGFFDNRCDEGIGEAIALTNAAIDRQ